MAVQIQLRRGTAAQWTSANPTLASGEVGYETDTNKEKIGDGTTAWNSLAYFGGGSPGGSTTQVQFNSSGSFAGDANLTFSGSTLTSANLIVSNLTVSQAVFSSSTKQLVSNPITGTGSVVMNASPIITSPSLITPALGSPASGNMAATTSIPVANATGTLAVVNGGTGLTSTPANGALDIGNGTGFTRTTLTAGTNVTITNGSGSITIASSGGGSPGGSSGQIQYNNSGAFGGFANLTYNLTGPIVNTTIGVGGTTPSTSGSGISFPATQSASSDVNTLDDYEEGTFTPAIAFGGASVGITYATQPGSYTKIGNKVFYFIGIQLSSKGSSTGAATITGLPFTAVGTTAYVPGSNFLGNMAAVTAPLMIRSISGTTTMDIYQVVANSFSAVTDTNYTNSTYTYVAGFYTTA